MILDKSSVPQFFDVLVVSLFHGGMEDNPQSFNKLSVNVPLANQAIDESLRTQLGATGAPPARLMVRAICQERGAIPQGIGIAFIIPLPTLSVGNHLTEINEGQSGQRRCVCGRRGFLVPVPRE